MILVGLGANLPHPVFGTPRATLRAALDLLDASGLAVIRRSRFYRSSPVPPSDQPLFVNAVAVVRSELPPAALLERLHDIERMFGRVRRERWEARVIDLDLLDVAGVVTTAGEGVRLPHPRLAERAFVLVPMAEVAPTWRHPVTGRSIVELLTVVPGRDDVVALEESEDA
ncbi:MAG: 2-amino-4-hydroxy-6-hydroxymethyldihydropteridine diphosphokinase [Alphaproteobacteria bacterium]|nr:2-amino-4-hydroxy-6-hydroxymethyldihydropteridine diphosphokinase [Alphaproteobacteria bacterium]